MKKTPIFLLSLCVLFLFSTCKKEEVTCDDNSPALPTELPPVTSSGANSFACLVDGEVWVSRSVGVFGAPTFGVSYELTAEGHINLLARRQYPDLEIDEAIILSCSNILDVGMYDFDDFLYAEGGDTSAYYFIIPDGASYLEITRVDSEVLSGKFEFELLNGEDDTDTLIISSGRFDISL